MLSSKTSLNSTLKLMPEEILNSGKKQIRSWLARALAPTKMA